MSRNWRFLRGINLVDVERAGRRARVHLLDDDGGGGPYEHPAEGKLGETLADGDAGYFKLPCTYWTESWHNELDLAGKAMLLIGLSLGDGFTLPPKRGPDWYGISPSTVERGLRQLHNHGLLHREKLRRQEVDVDVGFSDVYFYELTGSFGPRDFRSKSVHSLYKGAG